MMFLEFEYIIKYFINIISYLFVHDGAKINRENKTNEASLKIDQSVNNHNRTHKYLNKVLPPGGGPCEEYSDYDSSS